MSSGVVMLQRAGGSGGGDGFVHAARARRSGVYGYRPVVGS